jgi:hypothetical protein
MYGVTGRRPSTQENKKTKPARGFTIHSNLGAGGRDSSRHSTCRTTPQHGGLLRDCAGLRIGFARAHRCGEPYLSFTDAGMGRGPMQGGARARAIASPSLGDCSHPCPHFPTRARHLSQQVRVASEAMVSRVSTAIEGPHLCSFLDAARLSA